MKDNKYTIRGYKKEYNRNLAVYLKAEAYFKNDVDKFLSLPEDKQRVMLIKFNKVVKELSNLITKIESATGTRMTAKEKFRGFDL